jgi:hypothetical protein
MDTGTLQFALGAVVVAMLVMLYELRASLAPPVCGECPHCRAIVLERARRDEDLQTWYARKHGLEVDDEDELRRR